MAYPFRIGPTGPTVVRYRDPAGDGGGGVGAAEAEANDLAGYMDRLIKLVPAEILALYLTVRGIFLPPPQEDAAGAAAGAAATAADAPAGPADSFLGWWPLICLAILVVTRIWGTRGEDGKLASVQPVAVFIAAVSFIVWIYAMGDAVLGLTLPDPKLASVAVVVWVFLVPRFYRGGDSAALKPFRITA